MMKERFDTNMHLKGFKGNVVVSIGICVKNSEKTIKEAITSVLNQTFDKKQMEIIVVDDDSSDRTLSIIAEKASKASAKVKLYSTNGNGLTMARQMVVDNSSGDFVVFVDGDMVLSNDFVQNQVDVMKKNPLVGVAGGQMKGRPSRNLVAELEGMSISRDFEIGIHRNWRGNPEKLGTGGSIFRLAAIRKAGGFDTSIRGAAEDADITARIKSVGYLLFVGQAEFEHDFRQTLTGLWNQYAWYGHGMHYFYHKHKDLTESALVYFWPVSFAWSVIRSLLTFKNTHRKIAFFLPFFNLFKATAYWFGFFKAHRESYGHEYLYSERKK
jgi:glycosyltransferase involved in cell wall biosynthesis